MMDRIDRAGDLKRKLVKFGEEERFADELEEAEISYFEKSTQVSNAEYINFLDYFLLQYRLEDGQKVVDHFVDAHPELPREERDMLSGWKDVVEGLFEITRHEGDVLVMDNLIDDIVYRVRSNMGMANFHKMPPRSFIKARLVPLGDGWMLSGSLNLFPASSKNEVLRAAAEAIQRRPALMFRNPAKLEQAVEMQRKEKPDFVAFFGSDLVVLPAGMFAEQMNAYMLHRVQITTAAAAAAGKAAPAANQALPQNLQFAQPEWADEVETIGVIYDEVEGMTFYPDMGLVVEAFVDPEKVNDEPYAEIVRDYIQEPDISPLPIRLLAAQDPERASQVLRNLFARPDFSWERDGESFLVSYKREYESKALPGTLPLSERLVEALKTPPGRTPVVGKKVGRNEPCPCGSGKKYKQCCG